MWLLFALADAGDNTDDHRRKQEKAINAMRKERRRWKERERNK